MFSLRNDEISSLSQLRDLRPFSYYILFTKSSDLIFEPAEGFEAIFLSITFSLRNHQIPNLSQLKDLRPFSYYILFKKSSDLMFEPAEGFEVVFLLRSL